MYKRNVRPLIQFLSQSPPPGKYYVDAGFGKLYYKSDQVAGTLNTRTDAAGATLIVEVLGSRDVLQEQAERSGL